MDHIFGQSDDISFGGKGKNPKAEPIGTPPVRDRSHFGKTSQHPKKAFSSHKKAPEETVLDFSRETVPLARLLDNMKPTFLPNEDDSLLFRAVMLSGPDTQDPLLLLRLDTTTLLVGSGFGETVRAGKIYSTFPDMRLVYSEKERIHAWILTDENVKVQNFEHILPTLGFPPIYATRDIIAKFRNNIKNPEFLDKCRFFEILPPGTDTRRIGDIEILRGEQSRSIGLVFRGAHSAIFSGLHPLESGQARELTSPVLERNKDGFLFDGQSISSGEILCIHGKNIHKHQLKFTFDTFYVDKGSIGVLAGYTLTDREQLSENGVLIFTIEEDIRARTIKGHIFIDSRGFVHAHEMMAVHKEILKGIRVSYESCLLQNDRIERSELVQYLRREITKYCFLLTGRTPVVMPIITDRA